MIERVLLRTESVRIERRIYSKRRINFLAARIRIRIGYEENKVSESVIKSLLLIIRPLQHFSISILRINHKTPALERDRTVVSLKTKNTFESIGKPYSFKVHVKQNSLKEFI